MIRVHVVDFDGTVNAPVAVTFDVLELAERIEGRRLFAVHYFGGGRAGSRAPRAPWRDVRRPADLVILPGLGLRHAEAPEQALESPRGQRLIEALVTHDERGARIAASCTGTFALAESTLLDGKRATTSWWLAAAFRQRYPLVDLRETALTTEDGRLLCAAGSLAHIDLMLALMSRHFGEALGTTLARYLVSTARGPQSASADVLHMRVGDPLVAAAIGTIAKTLGEPLSVEAIARQIGASTRTLHRRVHASLGVSVIGLVRRVRAETAIGLLRETTLSFEQIVERVGYRDPAELRKLVTQLSGQTPHALRLRTRAAGRHVHEPSSPRPVGDPGRRAASSGQRRRRP